MPVFILELKVKMVLVNLSKIFKGKLLAVESWVGSPGAQHEIYVLYGISREARVL